MILVRAAVLGVGMCAALTACGSVPRENGSAVEEPTEIRAAEYRIRSAVNDREYQVSVILPEGYRANGTSRHGMFFILDASGPNEASFQQVSSLLGSRTPDVIWVGVGSSSDQLWYTERAADMTPSNDPDFDADTFKAVSAAADSAGRPMDEASLAALPRTGGASDFLKVLETEIIPLIETSFRTDGDRAIGGHSLSGLFVSYMLLERPELFDRYLISSPSLWWDDFAMIDNAEALAMADHDRSGRVFLSVGSAESEQMLRSKREFEAALLSFEGVTLEAAQFEGVSHEGAVLPAFLNGVPFLYLETE